MINGLYAAASGMEAQQTQLDAVSNDLANVDTPGYQAEVLGFHDLLYTSAGPQNATSFATGAGSAAQIVGRNQSAAQLQQTGQPLDVAVVGQGFLQVRRPDGTIGLTRNGTLELNANRQLTTSTGMLLTPPVTIPNGASSDKLTIAANGNVEVSGRVVGRIALVTVPNPNGLLDAGDSTFTRLGGQWRHAPGHRRDAEAGRAAGLQRRHDHRHGRDDRRPAQLPDGLARRSRCRTR